MEDHLRPVELGEHWSDEFAERLYEQRRRAKDLLQAERERICCAGSTLDQQLQALADQLAKDREQASRRESELERRAAELEEKAGELAQLKKEIDDRQSQWDQLQIEAVRNQEALLADLRKQHEQLHQRREELETLQQELQERRAEQDKEHAQWMQHRDAAEQELAHARQNPEESAELGDLQRRFEMAVQEVRELKTNNAELLEELVVLRQAAQVPSAVAAVEANGMDWESQKRRMLAQLDSDLDSSNPQQATDRLTIEGAVRITDQVVAEKEQEIRELKELLADQSGSLGSVAVGAAAIHEVLEQDDLIREERANLQRLQEECQAKLRQAEIDISLERAKLARERAEMEEKAHSYEIERSKSSSSDGAKGGPEQDKKSNRSRWRTRLGLSDSDD